jgi:hypothetical protein
MKLLWVPRKHVHLSDLKATLSIVPSPARFLTPIFVTCDISKSLLLHQFLKYNALILKLVALFIQLAGAVTIASIDPTDPDAQSKANKGKTIALIGLGIQICCFGLFSVIAVRFNFSSKRFEAEFENRITGSKDEKYCIIDGGERKLKRNWPALLRCVNIACLLILVRKQ